MSDSATAIGHTWQAPATEGGLQKRVFDYLFASLFKGLVYPQIWEDPEIDLEALAINPDSRVVAIASGGCNILSYLIADPAQITALDLSRAHIALNKLKLTAARHLPTADAFYCFFGDADEASNVAAYWRFLAPQLDAESRAYWERRGLGRRRISLFSRNVYRHGLLGRCIGFAHMLAKLYGIDPRDVLQARSLAEQRSYFRWLASRKISLYGLGIPVAQYHALAGGSHMTDVLRQRVERLACGFSLNDNYFAWQAFGRGYAQGGTGPLPPYLRAANFDVIRARADRVDVIRRTFTEHLKGCANASVDRYVLLDAQDWMSDADLNALWREITRTASPGARVIFRTAAEPSLLPGRVDDAILSRWHYEAEQSLAWTQRDRSAIYGGFHLYVFGG